MLEFQLFRDEHGADLQIRSRRLAPHPLEHLAPMLLPILRQIEQKPLVERSARGLRRAAGVSLMKISNRKVPPWGALRTPATRPAPPPTSAIPHRGPMSAESDVPMLTAFRRGLNETGYVVGIYCAAMLLARMTSPQSLISRLSSELAASGVCWSGGNSSMPPSSNVLRTVASASAWRSAALSRSTIGPGVPAGANRMCQNPRSSFL